MDTGKPMNSSSQVRDLAGHPAGPSARILSLPEDDPQFLRLRAMGLCEGRKVSVIRHGSRMILSVSGVRIGLDRDLAARIRITAGP